MNIPENILQAVADAAFEKIGVQCYKADRRAVIQHALDNPALAPFLTGCVGEYTDEEIQEAWRNTNLNRPDLNPFSSKWVNAFLAALPRRESPGLAQAIARAEKAEAECLSWKGNAEQAWEDHANLSKELGEAIARAEKAEAELSSQLGILRPLSEMPKTVPDGCVRMTGWKNADGIWSIGHIKASFDTHFVILRLPSAEATPPTQPEPKSKWICPEHFRLASEHAYEAARRPTAAEATPPAEPAAETTPNRDQAIADMEDDRANLSFEAAADATPTSPKS